jgi:hypothetical protein
LDKVAPYVDIIGQQARNLGHDLVGSHDALHDSTMTLGLFHFFVDHINNLDSHYPFVSRILAHSEFYQDFLSLS